MLNISRKLKATILASMMATSLLGTTLVSAAGPGYPSPHPEPPRHHRVDDSNNTAAAFVAGAIVGAVVEHNT